MDTNRHKWLRPSPMAMTRRLLLAVASIFCLELPLPLTAQTADTNAATLSAGLVRGFPDRTVNVPLSLFHTGSVAAVQFDLTYPSSKLRAGALQGATLANNAVLRSRKLSPSVYRMLAYANNGGVLSTNTDLGRLPFSVPGDVLSGGSQVTFSNALAASRLATGVSPLILGNGGVLISPVFRGDDGVVDLLLNTQSNRTYVIQASEDLVHWMNIATNFTALDYLITTDVAAKLYSRRFYRAVPVGSTPGGQIESVQIQASGLITFSYPVTPGRSYLLQASTNLTSWESFGTNVAGQSVLGFTNLINPDYQQRFYRVLELP